MLTKKQVVLYSLVGLLLLGIFNNPALADKGGHGKNKNRGDYSHYNGDEKVNVVINIQDREEIRHYIYNDYNHHCPPGLAKKHNGCMPPGQAKKYRVGYILPPDIYYVPVPSDLLVRLEPAPYGYQYVQVDKDILLISEASKKVIDAVTLLSAVGD